MLADYLISKNISCYKLAKSSDVSYTAINELLRGERSIENCSVSIAKKIASTLGISIEELCRVCDRDIQIPDSLCKCFWDCDFKSLNLINNKVYIITRLLDKGGYDGLTFLKQAYSYEDMKEAAQKSRNFSPKVASFLKNVFHLKESQMAYYSKNIKSWR